MGDQGGGFACAPFILVKMVIQRTQRRPQNHRKHTQVRKPPPGENIGIHSTLGGRLQDDFKGKERIILPILGPPAPLKPLGLNYVGLQSWGSWKQI